MTNKIIKEFRKETRKEKASDGVYRTRTRAFVEYTCYHCGNTHTVQKRSFSIDKPCKDCQKRLRGKHNFLEKAEKKFGNKFDLTQAAEEYWDITTPVTIRCVKHDYAYKVRPVHFVKKPIPNAPAKGGCPKCIEEVQLTKNKKPIEHYLAALNDKYPEIKVLSHGTAETNIEKIQLSCPIHGSFEKTLAHVVQADPLSSKLCPKCSKELHAWNSRMARTDISGIVYFVKFKDVNMYKCGVTYKTINDRLKGHLYNIEKLWQIPFSTLSDAYMFELYFFREYKHLRCSHPDTSLGGYTEFFSQPILKPNKRFIEEILCRKESNSGELPPQVCEDNPERSLEH